MSLPATAREIDLNALERLTALGLDAARIPRHIAVIMDGNGRWANERGLARAEGHL